MSLQQIIASVTVGATGLLVSGAVAVCSYLNAEADKLNSEGEELLRRGNYSGAAVKFRAAKEKCTPLYNGKEAFKDNMKHAKAEVLNEEGDSLYQKEQYAEAIIKYKAAYKKSPLSRIDHQSKYQNNEAKSLRGEGGKLSIRGDYVGAAAKFRAAYERCTSDYSDKQSFLDRMNSAEAEVLNEEGEELLSKRDYFGAAVKFLEAYQRGTVYSDKQTFQDNMNYAKAEILNEEGDNLYKEKQYAEAIVKYKAAYDHCPLSRIIDANKYKNNEANSLNHEGEKLLSRGDYLGAIVKFVAACERCTPTCSDEQTFIDNMNFAKAKVLNEEGEILCKQEIYLEAIVKFQEAWLQCPNNKKICLNVYKNNEASAMYFTGLEALKYDDYQEAANRFSQAYSECTDGFEKEHVFKEMRDKALAQYTTKQKCIGIPGYTFTEAQNLITNGKPNVEDPDKQNTIFIGNTLGGKSTIINYLLSKSLTAAKCDPNAKGTKGKVFKISLADPKEAGPTISASGRSMTTIPKKWHQPDAAYNKTIWDCPGFGDNRGPAIDISNACLLSQLLSNARNIRIVIVSDISDITSDNRAGFVNLIKQVNCLFGDLDKIKSCTMLLVTKVDDYDVDDIIADLKQIAEDVQDPELDKAFIQHLAAPGKIAIFSKPKKEGILHTEEAGIIAEAIDNIGSKHKLDVRVGISPDTKNFIFQNKSILLDELQECLESLISKLSSAFDITRIKTTEEMEIIRCQLVEMTEILNLKDDGANFKNLIIRIPKIFEEQKSWVNYKNCITEKEIKALNGKLDLVFFVESICDQQMVEFEDFRSDLIIAWHESEKKVTLCDIELQKLENKISQEEMLTQIINTENEAKAVQGQQQKKTNKYK